MRPQSHLGGRGKGRGGRPFRSGVHGQEARFIEIPLSPDLSPLLVPHGEREILCRYQWPHIRVPRVCASTAPCGTRGRSSATPSRQVTRRPCRFFLGAIRVPVPNPTDEANRCNLGHVTPKTLQKALYVGSFGSGRLLQVVCLGWSQFPIPEPRLAGYA
jgi:hypothetical protein